MSCTNFDLPLREVRQEATRFSIAEVPLNLVLGKARFYVLLHDSSDQEIPLPIQLNESEAQDLLVELNRRSPLNLQAAQVIAERFIDRGGAA